MSDTRIDIKAEDDYNLSGIMSQSAAVTQLSILVVDDEDAVRELLTWMLQDAGHLVYEAIDGQEALAFLRDHGRVDLVLSDVNMPRMDGLALSREMRTAWPAVPLLLISGRPPPSEPRPFLPKPFRWDTLSRAISSLAGGPAQPAAHCA